MQIRTRQPARLRALHGWIHIFQPIHASQSRPVPVRSRRAMPADSSADIARSHCSSKICRHHRANWLSNPAYRLIRLVAAKRTASSSRLPYSATNPTISTVRIAVRWISRRRRTSGGISEGRATARPHSGHRPASRRYAQCGQKPAGVYGSIRTVYPRRRALKPMRWLTRTRRREN